MKKLNQESFNKTIKQSQIRLRLKGELRFVASTSSFADEDWQNTELLKITDRSGNKGVLIIAPGDDDFYVIEYELSKGLINRQTGRAQPIVCDFCRTWQAGNGAGSISFSSNKQALYTVTFLCCADLACSRHVRGKTGAAQTSRAQLREDMTTEQRVERLKNRLQKIIGDLELQPVIFES